MIIQYKDKRAEIEFDSNSDGSIFVSNGYYIDSDKKLTDEEMDDITDNYWDVMREAVLDGHIMAADMMEDR